MKNVSNLNKKTLMALGLSVIMNVTNGRIGYYKNMVLPLGGKYTIKMLLDDMEVIDQHWEAVEMMEDAE